MPLIGSRTKPVAFIDLAALHAPLQDRLDAAWRDILAGSAFIGGSAVDDFEQRWADYCGTDHCVGVANGTDALELVLSALHIGPGDEVLVPANTFVATAEAVLTVGATPVFVDVDPGSLLITAPAIAAAITPATRAVMVVHLYGQIPDMDSITAVADAAGIEVVEDAAQAHGATFDGRRAGSFGAAATFSFYPGKNLGALGDGGAVVTNDRGLADEVRTLANHGRGTHLLHTHRGRNSRLDGLQAAVLNCRLIHLEADNQRRRQVAAHYRQELEGAGDLVFLRDSGQAEPVYHQMTVRTAHRDALKEHLAAIGIGTAIHYPEPLHRQPAFEHLGLGRQEQPEASAAAREVLCLPMFPEITEQEVAQVCSGVRSFFSG